VPTLDENEVPPVPETRSVQVDDLYMNIEPQVHRTRSVDINELYIDCFWALPKFDNQGRHPFRFETLHHYQQLDPKLAKLVETDPNYRYTKYGQTPLVTTSWDDGTVNIVLTDAILPKIVKWYHLLTNHSEGMTRLEKTIRRHFYHPDLRKEIQKQLDACETCAKMKKYSRKEGQLSPRNLPTIPWLEVHVDCIGPWTYSVGTKTVKVRALTMIDPVTNLVEIDRIYSTKSEEVTDSFVNTWLSRYPLPETVVSDNGPEFRGADWEFNAMDWGIKKKHTTSYTPTANGVIESVHRAMGQILRTIVDRESPTTIAQMDKVVDDALAQTIRACRCASNSSLQGFAPGAIVFGRDMNLNIPIISDIISISENRQLQTDLRLQRENQKRSHHEYLVGEQVFLNNHHDASDKMKPAWVGPYPILQVHTNGTVTLQRGEIHERVSIRHIKPSKA